MTSTDSAAIAARLDPAALAVARAARGFMPDDEGLALAAAALEAPRSGRWLEVGSYCGRSTAYLGAAALVCGAGLVTVDHHRGSEENQPGERYHDADLIDDEGLVDTLPALRRTLRDAGLEDVVVAIVGESTTVAAMWSTTPLAFVFLDGGHSAAVQHGDFDAWTPHLGRGGLLAIHDVFPDPRDGGRPPYEIYLRALNSDFDEVGATGSLRVLRRR